MTCLLDVNVLVSLAWPNHVHHARAQAWFRGHAGPWATTPVTESGFVRVCSNTAAIPTAVTPVEALTLLGRIRALPRHEFLPDDLPMVVSDAVDPTLIATHRHVTDAHLLALARRHQAQLVTFDRGVVSLAGTSSDVVTV